MADTQKEELVVKFISKKSHIGSEEKVASRVRSQSKASGKFNMTLNVQVREKVKESPKTDDPSTRVVPDKKDLTPGDAALIANRLFDHMEKQGNSEAYTSRKAEFDTIKTNVLNSFGVSSYSDLSTDQRIMYARKMAKLKAPFVYTERSIHIKYGSNATIFSRTYRLLGVKHWPEDMSINKIASLPVLKDKFVVYERFTNNTID